MARIWVLRVSGVGYEIFGLDPKRSNLVLKASGSGSVGLSFLVSDFC